MLDLSNAVSDLLSSDNRDKSLGETSEVLHDYMIKIKKLVDSGEISLETLKDEISKNLKDKTDVVPNSLAQLLIGCVGDNEACMMKTEKPEDVAFFYDYTNKKLQSLSGDTTPLTRDSVAVLYITGDPEKIDPGSLEFLENQGFKKLRIEYKDVKSSSYKVINIDNLKRYIYFRPGENDVYQSLAILGFLLLIIFMMYRFND